MNFLEVMTGTDFCSKLGIIPDLVNSIINLIKWGIPIVLIIFGMIDLGKAVMAGKEDEMKKAQGTLIKRVIYAVVVFLVVQIVVFAMALIGENNNDAGSWYTCIFGQTNSNTSSNNKSGE